MQSELTKQQKSLQEEKKECERLLCDYEGEIASLKLNIKLTKKHLEKAEKEKLDDKTKKAREELKKKITEGILNLFGRGQGTSKL